MTGWLAVPEAGGQYAERPDRYYHGLLPRVSGFAAAPGRRVAGSPGRRIAGSPGRRVAGSPDRRIAGSRA